MAPIGHASNPYKKQGIHLSFNHTFHFYFPAGGDIHMCYILPIFLYFQSVVIAIFYNASHASICAGASIRLVSGAVTVPEREYATSR